MWEKTKIILLVGIILESLQWKSWIQIHERNKTWLLLEYIWTGCWTECNDTSRTQDHEFMLAWFWYSFWLWFLFQQVCCDYVLWSTWLCEWDSKRIKFYVALRWVGFKEDKILRSPTPIVSLFVANMEWHTALYVYTSIIQIQLVGDVRGTLLWVVLVKSR